MNEEFKIPGEGTETGWNNFSFFPKESEYVSPKNVGEESIKRIKSRKIGKSIFAALKGE